MTSNFSLISLGCARTLVDSETLVQNIQSVGFSMVPEGTNEQVTVLNTCSFIQSAIVETEANINALIHRKSAGDIQYICVVGCYPSRFKASDLAEKYPDVDLWCTTKDEKILHEQLAQLVFKKKFTPQTPTAYTRIRPHHYAYLKISEGCNNWCSFCTIPKIRGVHTSRPIDQIRQDAQLQLAMGAKELVLIAEDTTAWGEDLYGTPCLERLLEGLSDLDAWIRLMYIFPARVNDTLIHAMSTIPNIIPYIDMPIQHVNSSILSAMNRRHDRPFLETIIADMRRAIPDLSIRTTFICGFPGETDEQHAEILDFLDHVRIDQIGCFAYSNESHTRAHRMTHQVPADVAQDRVTRIMDHHYAQRGDRQLKQLGQSRVVVYEGNRLSRSVHEAPDVDNVIVLNAVPDTLQVGDRLTVRLSGVSGIDFTADIERHP